MESEGSGAGGDSNGNGDGTVQKKKVVLRGVGGDGDDRQMARRKEG